MVQSSNPVRLSPLEVVLVRKYFEMIFYRRLGPVLTKRFYWHLFATQPTLRDVFPANMQHQNQKLARSIKLLIEVLPDLDRLDDHFMRLAHVHQKLGLSDSDFRLFATCLIKALEDLSSEAMIREARTALTRLCLEIGRRIMSWVPSAPKRRAA